MAAKNDIPFTRPNDYYAEMVKSDEHMERIRTKLVDEALVSPSCFPSSHLLKGL